MSRHERYGTRDLTFSQWHRSLGDEVTCIDLDFCEYCNRCKQPLLLIETARDVGQGFKPTTVLRNLAEKAGIKAVLVLYMLDEKATHGISTVRMARVHPQPTKLLARTIDDVGTYLTRIHQSCPCLRKVES